MKKIILFFLTILTIPFSAQSQDYIGQWRSSDTTELVEITADTIFVYELEDNCYDLTKINYTVESSHSWSLLIEGQSVPVIYNLTNANTTLTLFSSFDTTTYYSHTFDISQYEPCSDITSSDGEYIGNWMTLSAPLMYLEFTSDSLFVYGFDSVNCYTLNRITCTDLGNNQLLISGLATTSYTISNFGLNMTVSIFGLGDLQLVKTPFNPDNWVECTYKWECNYTSGVCEDVGLNQGSYNTQLSCQAICLVDTTSIEEYDLNVNIYPNPFSDYATIQFNDNVSHYQLFDVSGRLLFEKQVVGSIEYLQKNDLTTGVYFLQFMGQNKMGREKIVID
jgi:hypothetical protein